MRVRGEGESEEMGGEEAGGTQRTACAEGGAPGPVTCRRLGLPRPGPWRATLSRVGLGPPARGSGLDGLGI